MLDSRLSVPALTNFFDDLANASLTPSKTFPFLNRVPVATADEALAPDEAALAAPPPAALAAAAPFALTVQNISIMIIY